MADSSSSLISRNDYDSFGEIVSSTGSSQNAVTYTGQRLDVESGLMALGNGERYYNPSYGRFIQQDSYAGMPDMPQSLNRFSYVYNNPFKYVDPSGNEGVLADQMRSQVQNGIANTGSETLDWWINLGANFVTGFAYDAANTATGGLLGTADVMMQDITNGKFPNPIDAWQRGGYSATQGQIYTNFAYYNAGAVKGVANGAYNIVTGIPALAYGLTTDPGGTLNNIWLGLADKTASVIDTALNPRKALDDLAQHSQEDIAFGVGEVVGEAAFDVATAKLSISKLAKTKYGKSTIKSVTESKAFRKADASIKRKIRKSSNTKNNASETKIDVNKESIIKELKSANSIHTNKIAESIKRGDIGVNLLGDEMFKKAFLDKGGTLDELKGLDAFSLEEQIYLRKSSDAVYSEAVHEGTHSLDFLDGFNGSNHKWEKRAFHHERQYQLRTRRPVDFPRYENMLQSIKDNYDDY